MKFPSADDKREFHLRVTDKFFGYLGMRSQFLTDSVSSLESKYSKEELALFEQMLRDLNDSLTDIK